MSVKKVNQVKCNNIEYDKIKARDPVQKNIPNSTMKYSEIILDYLYPHSDEFLVEFPELHSRYGIHYNNFGDTEGNKGKWMIDVYFTDYKTPDSRDYMMYNAINKIYAATAQLLFNARGAVGLKKFKLEDPTGTGFKSPIFIKTDEQDNPIQGVVPKVSLPLIKYGETIFTKPNLKKIPKNLIEDCEITFVPLVHFKKIYIGAGKASLQYEIKSAIITTVANRSSSSSQKDTADSIISQNPGVLDALDEQLAMLTMEGRNDKREVRKSDTSDASSSGPEKPSLESYDFNDFASKTMDNA